MKNFERYQRNIEITGLDKEDQLKIFNAKVLVCGCGGLGSAVLSSLASLGVGKLGIVDYDVLEKSNFNRQFIHSWENVGKNKISSAQNWINNYNPDIEVKEYNLKLDKTNYQDVFIGYDIVVDCFDSYESKFLLNEVCIKEGKILIHGGVEEFRGQVLSIIPKETACLNCILPHGETQTNLKGIISPVVNTIGSIQSMEVFKAITGKGSLLTDCILSYDCIENRLKKIKISQNTNCKVCSIN